MKIYDSVNNDILKEIKQVLDNDGLIIFPTDTVYGLACNAFSEVAIKKLFLVKSRNLNNPINVLTNSISKINFATEKITKFEKELMTKYWPGNLTIILHKKSNISNILTANKNTIGVRIPNNQIALQILENYPFPLATTSVNLSGEEAGCQLSDFINIFKDKVDIIIDGGKTSQTPSTIIKVINNKVCILRQGSLKIPAFEKIKIGE